MRSRFWPGRLSPVRGYNSSATIRDGRLPGPTPAARGNSWVTASTDRPHARSMGMITGRVPRRPCAIAREVGRRLMPATMRWVLPFRGPPLTPTSRAAYARVVNNTVGTGAVELQGSLGGHGLRRFTFLCFSVRCGGERRSTVVEYGNGTVSGQHAGERPSRPRTPGRFVCLSSIPRPPVWLLHQSGAVASVNEFHTRSPAQSPDASGTLHFSPGAALGGGHNSQSQRR